MKYALIDSAGVVTATRGEPYTDSTLGEYILVPDEVQPGWERVAGVWQKGGALAAKEASISDIAIKKGQVKSALAALKAGTGTAAERLARLEKALAYLIEFELRN